MLRKKLVFDSRLNGASDHSHSNYLVHDPSLLQYKNIVIREVAVTVPKETITDINNTCKVTLEWLNGNTASSPFTTDFTLDNGVYNVENVTLFRNMFNSKMVNVLTDFKTHLDSGLHYIEADNTQKMITNSNIVQMTTTATAPDDIQMTFTNFNGVISPNPATFGSSILKITFSPVTERYGSGGISSILNSESDPFFKMLGMNDREVNIFDPSQTDTSITLHSPLKSPDSIFLRSSDLIKNTGYSLISNVNAVSNSTIHNDVVAILNLDKRKETNRFVFNNGEYTFSISDRSNSFATILNFKLTDIADNIIPSKPSDYLQIICDMV